MMVDYDLLFHQSHRDRKRANSDSRSLTPRGGKQQTSQKKDGDRLETAIAKAPSSPSFSLDESFPTSSSAPSTSAWLSGAKGRERPDVEKHLFLRESPPSAAAPADCPTET